MILNIILQFWCPAVQPGFVQLSSIILYYTTRYCTVATRKVSCLPEQADPNESDEDNEEMVEKKKN